MGFHEVQFPDDIAYGSSGGPGFSTNVIVTDSGAEERVARWSESRHRYNIAYRIRTLDQLNIVIAFYLKRNGVANGFRYKDWQEFTSASNGRDAHTNADVSIGTGDASDTTFQLVQKYTDAVVTRTRIITKPVSGKVLIALAGVGQTEGADFTVNTTTGLITFTSTPGDGVNITAGYEFDVPVRFGEEVDALLSINYTSFEEGDIADIPLIEIVNEEPVDDEFYFGGAKTTSITGDISLTQIDGRVHLITPDSNGHKVFLPVKTNLKPGGPYFYFINGSGTNTFLLRTSDDVAIVTIATSALVTIVLGLDSSSVLTWYAF